jgi:hypothetical protein
MIEVALTRAVDGECIVEALLAHGLQAAYAADGDRFRVEVEPNGAGEGDVTHALEMCVAARGLPFIPTPLGDGGYVLRPPAG